jgi:chromosomal replication initiator protein
MMLKQSHADTAIGSVAVGFHLPAEAGDAGANESGWPRVKRRLRIEVGEDIFSSWFARMDLEAVDGDGVRLSVPTRFLKSWILAHYAERVLTCWQAEDPTIQRIDLEVRSAVLRPLPIKGKTAEGATAGREARAAALETTARGSEPPACNTETPGGSPLDPRLTFESFLVGRSNTLAHAAAKQVARARRGDPVMFNPLYIHAGVGLGKTHLLQAVASAGNGRDRKALYLTAEKFMYGFVSALKTQTALAFKEALRGIDLLIIDDLQFLQGKQTQVEFCHTLNALVDSGRQVVVAADRPPSDLESLEDRVRSRLAGGLVVEIGSLEEELRLEILQARVGAARAHHPGFDVPAPVLVFIAKTVTHNGRDLDGALNRLLAHNKLTGQPVTMEMAELAIRDLIRPQEPKRVKIGTSSAPSRATTMSAAPTCCRRAAPPTLCARARSRCTLPRRSRCARCPRSADVLAVAITPPCCMRCARSRASAIATRPSPMRSRP